MPDLQLSDSTIAAINKAHDDQAAAKAAVQGVTNSQGAMHSAQDAYNASQDKALTAQKQALASAHAALDALAGELGLSTTPAALAAQQKR